MTDLSRDLTDLARALDALDERTGGALEAQARAAHGLLERVTSRRALAPGTLVVALAGTTGAGKSSLFNAITGTHHAAAGVRRPTTTEPAAAILGPPEAGVGGLLDRLGVTDRYTVTDPGELSSVILIDLPDIDSIARHNRLAAERFIATADVLLWVVDPEKYADARLHEDYLRPLAGHAPVMDVVLNQTDRLTPEEIALATADLRGRLREGGIGSEVFTTSVLTGEGVEEVVARLRARAERKQDQSARLHYDAAALGRRLAQEHPPVPPDLARPSFQGFADDVTASAGAAQFARAAAAGYRHRLLRATGWPPLRPLHRSRRTPPQPQLRTTFLAEPVARLSAGFAGRGTWLELLRRAAAEAGEGMRRRLDLYRPAPPAPGRPGWVSVMGALQWIPIALLVIAALLLGAEVGVRYFGLTLPPALAPVPAEGWYPALPAVPWSVATAIVALVTMPLIAGLAAVFRRGATRRYRRAVEQRVRREVRGLVEETVSGPLTALLEDAATYAGALTKITQTGGGAPGENVRRRREAP